LKRFPNLLVQSNQKYLTKKVIKMAHNKFVKKKEIINKEIKEKLPQEGFQ
jgi:hypothetical protein